MSLGCGPQPGDPGPPAAGSTSSAADGSSGSPGASSSSESGAADPTEVEPEIIDASDLSRCSPGELGDGCVQGDGHCMCGPRCSEYGPAGIPGRCPLGPDGFYAVCSDVYVCLVTCREDSECPDPEMVCRPCPEDLDHGCIELGSIGISDGYNGGDMMCTYAER